MIRTLSIGLIAILLPMAAQPLNQNAIEDGAAKEALRELEFERRLFNGRPNFLGKEPVSLSADIKLGKGIRVFDVDIKELAQYDPSGSPENIFHDVESVIFPVLVDGQIRSCIQVSKGLGTWHYVSVDGGASIIRTTLSRIKQIEQEGKTVIGQVEILGLYLLISEGGNQLFLTSIFDSPNEKINAGIDYPAKILLTQLKATASAVDPNIPGG